LRKSLTALILCVIFFSVSAQALYVNVPANIIVQQGQKDVPITIRNDSDFEEDYSISFSIPFNAMVNPSFGTLAAGKTTISTLSIQPDKELEASSYDLTMEVKLGEEKAFRNIKVMFKEDLEEEEEQDISTIGFFSLAGSADFILSLFTYENTINAFLVVVAGILLIAFIARFTRRLEEMK